MGKVCSKRDYHQTSRSQIKPTANHPSCYTLRICKLFLIADSVSPISGYIRNKSYKASLLEKKNQRKEYLLKENPPTESNNTRKQYIESIVLLQNFKKFKNRNFSKKRWRNLYPSSKLWVWFISNCTERKIWKAWRWNIFFESLRRFILGNIRCWG